MVLMIAIDIFDETEDLWNSENEKRGKPYWLSPLWVVLFVF